MRHSSSVRISPTAHYTGAVWLRHGLSDPRLGTGQGRLFHAALAPAMALSRRIQGPTLESFLLARHILIDHLLEQAIAKQGVRQVIEIAAGLSPRGLRFASRHAGRLRYIETDLPPMASLKAGRLGLSGEGLHCVVAVDALQTDGPGSLAALCQRLDPTLPTAIITEGLINYFPQPLVLQLWRNIAQALSGFPSGLYLSDIHCHADNTSPLVDAFVKGLSVFVRGQVGLLFDNAADARAQMQACGFDRSALHCPSDWQHELSACADPWANLVRVIEAFV